MRAVRIGRIKCLYTHNFSRNNTLESQSNRGCVGSNRSTVVSRRNRTNPQFESSGPTTGSSDEYMRVQNASNQRTQLMRYTRNWDAIAF